MEETLYQGKSTTQASGDASKIVDDLHLLTTCG